MGQSLFTRIESILRAKTARPEIASSVEELVDRSRKWWRTTVKFHLPHFQKVYGEGNDPVTMFFFVPLVCCLIGVGLAGMLGWIAWHNENIFLKIVSFPLFGITGCSVLLILFIFLSYPLVIANNLVHFFKERRGTHLVIGDLITNYLNAEIERCQKETLGEQAPIILIQKEIEATGHELGTLKEQFSVAIQSAQDDLAEILKNGLERVERLINRLNESEQRIRTHHAKLNAFFNECRGNTQRIGGPLKTRQLFEKLSQYEEGERFLFTRIDEAIYASTISVEQALHSVAHNHTLLLRESGVAAGISGRTPLERVELLESTIKRLMDETGIPPLPHHMTE